MDLALRMSPERKIVILGVVGLIMIMFMAFLICHEDVLCKKKGGVLIEHNHCVKKGVLL